MLKGGNNLMIMRNSKQQYKIVIDPQYGYRHLEPLPTSEELERFYVEKYFSDIAKSNTRALGIKRLMKEDDEKQFELNWLSATRWRDIFDILNQNLSDGQKRSLLDVGCGLGHFGQYMAQAGYRVSGIEPSRYAQEVARSFGINIYSAIEDCLQAGQYFDAITLLYVLEHIPDPVDMLKKVQKLMKKDSLLVIMVPNDFSTLQVSACNKLGLAPWWIAIPDHINYFNFESIVKLVEQLGFQVIEIYGDFPMEMFLLFGDVYVGNPELGSLCHKKRVSFELALAPEVRRDIYRTFAKAGIGRSCLLFAKYS